MCWKNYKRPWKTRRHAERGGVKSMGDVLVGGEKGLGGRLHSISTKKQKKGGGDADVVGKEGGPSETR